MVGLVKNHRISAGAQRWEGWLCVHWKSPTSCQVWYKPSEVNRTHVENGPSVCNLHHLWINSTRVIMLFLLNAITTKKVPLHLKLTEHMNNDFLFHARSLKLPHKKSASFCSQQLTFISFVCWHMAGDNYWLHSLPWSTFLLQLRNPLNCGQLTFPVLKIASN